MVANSPLTQGLTCTLLPHFNVPNNLGVSIEHKEQFSSLEINIFVLLI